MSKHRVNRFAVTMTTVLATAVFIFAGFSQAGAVGANSYGCGTYGSGSYNAGSCATAPSTATSSTSTTPASSPSTSASNPSRSGSTPSSSADIVLNNYPEYTKPQGKSLAFKVGDVIYFYLDGLKQPIIVKTFSATSLILTVGNTPSDVTIQINQKVPFDANADGKPDISFEYTALSTDGKTASATFRAMSDAAAVVTTPSPTVTGTSSGSPTGATIRGTDSKGFWWIWLIPIILGLGLIILAARSAMRRRRAAAAATTPTFFNHY